LSIIVEINSVWQLLEQKTRTDGLKNVLSAIVRRVYRASGLLFAYEKEESGVKEYGSSRILVEPTP